MAKTSPHEVTKLLVDWSNGDLKRLQTSKGYVSPAELAVLYTTLDEREQALASLERAYVEHDYQLQFLAVNPAPDSLRSDPRFQNLIIALDSRLNFLSQFISNEA